MEACYDDIHSAYTLAQKNSPNHTVNELPPTDEEAFVLLEVIKHVRTQTKDFFASILRNVGVGIFKPSDGRPFNRNLLFNKSNTSPFLKIYSPSWLKEIRRCHLKLWSLASSDASVGDLYDYVQDFKHEWEDFFKTIGDNFPESATDLVSDFEFSGMEMFNNFEVSIISATANPEDPESDLGEFEAYLPEIKKVLIKEFKQKPVTNKQTSDSQESAERKLLTADDVIKDEYKKDAAKESNHLENLRQSLRNNWMYLFGYEKHDHGPKGASEFDVLIYYIEKEIEDFKEGKARAPGSLSTWQNVLPLALTYPCDRYDYGLEFTHFLNVKVRLTPINKG